MTYRKTDRNLFRHGKAKGMLDIGEIKVLRGMAGETLMELKGSKNI